MILLRYIVLLLATNFAGIFYAQEIGGPSIKVDSLLFTDSTRVEVTHPNKEVTIMIEFAEGNVEFFKECEPEFYVHDTKTIRVKASHPDFLDSPIIVANLSKKSTVKIDLSGEHQILVDGKKGGLDLSPEEWVSMKEKEIVFNFRTDLKRIEEVELLSAIYTEKEIYPPKKVMLHAILKSGEKVHIRTSSIIGSFADSKEYWSHTLRLVGKPKLKKILRKAEYFSLTAIPYFSEGEPRKVFFDELLVR